MQKDAKVRSAIYGAADTPMRFGPVQIAGGDALYVFIRSCHRTMLCHWTSNLGISVRNEFSSIVWREDAKAAADAILKSINISPKN